MNASPDTHDRTREEIILTIAAGAHGSYDLDPIRLMKGCFLVSQHGREGWKAAFHFKPYAYGPFDQGVYQARDALLARGLLHADDHGRYPSYHVSDEGQAEVERVRNQLGEADAAWLGRIGAYVTSKSFSKLLEEVYAAFPDFAVRSVVAH